MIQCEVYVIQIGGVHTTSNQNKVYFSKISRPGVGVTLLISRVDDAGDRAHLTREHPLRVAVEQRPVLTEVAFRQGPNQHW